MADYRSRFEDSDVDTETIGEIAGELHQSDGFESDLTAAVRDVFEDHLDEIGAEFDTVAAAEFEEQLVRNGTSGLFLIRNGTITNAQIGLEEGDVIRMEHANDPDDVSFYVIRSARPEATRAEVWCAKAGLEDPMATDADPGQITYSDRFEVVESLQDDDRRAFQIAQDLIDELEEETDPEGVTADA